MATRSPTAGIGQINRMSSSTTTDCLIIGANGLVGRRVGDILSRQSRPWIGTFHKRREKGLQKLDITDIQKLKEFISSYQPNVVFHCANLAGGVDFCEKRPDEAEVFHFTATQQMGETCRKIGAVLVFISTDYVFDGMRSPYHEEDSPNPLNAYGALKLRAENWIRKHLDRYVIARTTNVYGWDSQTVTPNFLMGAYRRISKEEKIVVPSFLYGSPTCAEDLARALVELYQKNAKGLFHIVGPDFMDRYAWAGLAAKIFGWNVSLIQELKTPPAGMIPRPFSPRLDCRKFLSRFTTALRPPIEGMKRMKEEMKNLR